MAIAVVGMLLLSRMGAGVHNGLVVRNMVITGLGMGTMMSLFTIVVQNAFPFRMLGAVTSTLQFFRSIGSTVGIAVFGSVLTARFTHELSRQIPASVKRALPAHALDQISNPSTLLNSSASAQMQHAFARFGPAGAALAKQLIHGVRTALAMGADRIFFLGAILLFLSLITLFFLKEIALKKQTGDAPEQSGLDAHTARAVVGIAIARKLKDGGFGDEASQLRAKAAAVHLLRQYLAEQERRALERRAVPGEG
jgi:hypothetical protein